MYPSPTFIAKRTGLAPLTVSRNLSYLRENSFVEQHLLPVGLSKVQCSSYSITTKGRKLYSVLADGQSALNALLSSQASY
jgi:DNA-binding HxlR family transcriptional regulator